VIKCATYSVVFKFQETELFVTRKKNTPPASSLADAVRKLRKAVPPQDNPLLRNQSEEISRSEDEKRNAESRVRALNKLKKTSTRQLEKCDSPGEPDQA
jgi:hypothetical protein